MGSFAPTDAQRKIWSFCCLFVCLSMDEFVPYLMGTCPYSLLTKHYVSYRTVKIDWIMYILMKVWWSFTHNVRQRLIFDWFAAFFFSFRICSRSCCCCCSVLVVLLPCRCAFSCLLLVFFFFFVVVFVVACVFVADILCSCSCIHIVIVDAARFHSVLPSPWSIRFGF